MPRGPRCWRCNRYLEYDTVEGELVENCPPCRKHINWLEGRLKKQRGREAKYHARHREQINARKRQTYLKDKEKELARCQAYRDANKDAINERRRKAYVLP